MSDRIEATEAAIRDAAARGRLMAAVDLAATAIRERREAGERPPPRLLYLEALCLARAGALDEARKRYRDADLGASGDLDARCLEGRFHKDEASRRSGPASAAAYAEAAAVYRAVYEDPSTPPARRGFPGINAATTAALSGAAALGRRIAEELLAADRWEAGAWGLVTRAEALILADRAEEAAEPLARAAAEPAYGLDDRASTMRQLDLLLRAKDLDPGLLDPLRPKPVAAISGHMIAAAGEASGRILADREAELAARLHATLDALDPFAVYASLACGSDVLAAEWAMARDRELHLFLPCSTEDFIRVSVRRGGAGWEARARACLAAATEVSHLSPQPYLDNPGVFAINALTLQGRARLHARHVFGEAVLVAVWDGEPPSGPSGTAADVAGWRRVGGREAIVAVGDLGARSAEARGPDGFPAPTGPRVEVGMVFGDVRGFSKLTDGQMPAFAEHALGAMAAALDAAEVPPLFRNTWGDGLFAVFPDALSAVRAALEVKRRFAGLRAEIEAGRIDLPGDLGLRLAVHYGSTLRARDPVIGRDNHFGETVARAARIEPITPPGEVYATDVCAAIVEMTPGAGVACDYVGTVETAKRYGRLPLFNVKAVA